MRTKSGPRSGRGGRGVARQSSVKATSQSTTSELDTDFHNDMSQQQVPIPTSVRSMRDLCRLMETATEEIQEYLTEEFSIMYECKICYSIFRSLANLISHKRFYCTTRFINRPRPADRDYVLEQLTQLVIPTEPDVATEERWHLGDDGQSVTSSQPWATSIKTSIPPIGQGGSGSKMRDSGNGGVPPAQDSKLDAEFSVHLEHLTKNAVYQTVSYEGTIGDLMSDQVAEVQSLNVDSQVTLGPDGKILSEQPHEEAEAEKEESKVAKDGNVNKTTPKKITKNERQTTGSQYYVCGICNSTCSTRKTLSYHMQYMHSKYRMCYPCICCKSTFSKIWNLTRHLCKVHHKSTHQVNKLREIIQKKAFKKPLKDCKKVKVIKIKEDAAAHTEPSSKLSRQQQLIQENQIFMENVDGISKTQVCVACGTKFERQAALCSHLQRCPKMLRKLKLQTAAAGGAVDASTRPAAEAETTKNLARVCSAPLATETDDDYDEDDQRVSLMLSDVPPIASHVSFSAKGVDTVVVESEELPQHVVTDRGRSEKIQIVNPYRCGSERDSSTEKKIKIEVRKDYVKSVGANTKNTLCSTLSDDFSEVASPMSAMCYRGENSDSDEGGKGSMGGSEDQCNQTEMLELDVGFGEKERTVSSHTDVKEPEGAHKRFLFSREVVVGAPKMISILKKSEELNSSMCTGVSNSSSTMETALDIKPNVNLSTTFPPKKADFSPHMQKKMESLINANKLQCLTCRKKFKKMTNLRRHVALHIDWYRYRCTLCSFRCFAKYDCVAHIIKTHLKGADRVQASSLVELLQNQEPESRAEDDIQTQVDIGEKKMSENTIENRLEEEEIIGHSEIVDVGSDCKTELLQVHGGTENMLKESDLENISTSVVGTLPEDTSPYFVDSPNNNNNNVCSRIVEVTDSQEELSVKSTDVSCVPSSASVDCIGQESQEPPKELLLENNLDVVVDKHVSEKDNVPQSEKICSTSFDGKLYISTSCCTGDSFQTDEDVCVGKDTASMKDHVEKDESDTEIIIEYKKIVTPMNSIVETTSTPMRVEEQVNVPIVDGCAESMTLPAQDATIEVSLLAQSSAEKVISAQKHAEISSDSSGESVDSKKRNVYKINSSLRCSDEKQASLRKVIDKILLHGKDLNLKNDDSNTDLQEPKEITSESVLIEPGESDDVSISSAVSQNDDNVPVINCKENVYVPNVCVKTEMDTDITIEYEGKRLTNIERRDGYFVPRKRLGRIGSDSSMMCETDELRSVHCSSPTGYFPPKKRKRSNSESRGCSKKSAQSSFSSDHIVDAGARSKSDAAKSSTCSVEGSPLKDITVQQMVMQVIFGNENGQESSEDFTLNGDVFVPKGGDYCPSAAESASTASSSPNWMLEEPMSNCSGGASPDSDVAYCTTIPQQQAKSCASGSSRKRLRPIRNRVKVEREDFIYDYGLSDICILQKEKVTEEAKKLAKRKEQLERCDKESPSKVNVRNTVFPNFLSQDVKLVLPKLTLVRTDDPSVRNEYCVKIGEDSKTSSSIGCSNPGKSGMTSRKKTSATS